MFLHRVISTYGRLIPKPEKDESHEEIFEEVVPIQDQIENLRTKIALKERYNRVLAEEFEESALGASSILQDLYYETRELRVRFMAAIFSEKAAVQNALRTHRKFQLAMTERKASQAIPWLDDKLFDVIKHLNFLLDHLTHKRKKLEEAERMVIMIEKWPRPGTLPWELDALEQFHYLENRIESVKVKRETAFILHSKYYEIKFILREERGKYLPTLLALETQLRVQKNELRNLQKMLDDANGFRDDAGKNMAITEKESIENRKVRRKQMAKMKKAVERVLNENHAGVSAFRKRLSIGYGKDDPAASTTEVYDVIRIKREEVERYEVRAKRLVDIMRVPDLTKIPIRYKTVQALGQQLNLEEDLKKEVRNRLIKQRDQLMLILSHFKYTGRKQETDFENREKDCAAALVQVQDDLQQSHKRLQYYGDITVDLRLSMLAVLERLDEGRPVHHELTPDLKVQMKSVYGKLKKLVKTVDEYEKMFKGREPERGYGPFAKLPTILPRHVRVGSPVASDEEDDAEPDDDDLPDMKIPGRLEIKAKSQRVIQQAIIKRGLR